MGVGKVLWKLKGLILFVVLILVIVIVVAMMINKDKNVVAPEVSAGNVVKDNTKKLSVNSSVLFGFPLSLACYDKAGDVVSNILAAGSGNGQNFHEGTAKITASVATVKEKEGPGVHEQGREYKIYIKGQYKEPKAKKNASIHATNLTEPWPQVIH